MEKSTESTVYKVSVEIRVGILVFKLYEVLNVLKPVEVKFTLHLLLFALNGGLILVHALL